MRETTKMQVVSRRESHKPNVLPKTSKTVKKSQSNKQVRKTSRKMDGDKKRVVTAKPLSAKLPLLQDSFGYIDYQFRPQNWKRKKPKTKTRVIQPLALLRTRQHPKRKSRLRDILSKILSPFTRGRKWLLSVFVSSVISLSKKLKERRSITANVQRHLSVLVLAAGTFGFYRDHVKYDILTYIAGLLAVWLLVHKILMVK